MSWGAMISARPSTQVVVGVDVGGPKKGFHAVALSNGQFHGKLATLNPEAVVQWSQSLHASAVGIDAPCCWRLARHARPCERGLAAEGIFSFSTPSRTVGASHPFYEWMRNGAELFRLLQPHYQLFNGGYSHSSPVCFETFPQAVACAVAGTVLSAKYKRRDRPRLLRQTGFSTAVLDNIDEVDAALCALTALHLSAGTFKTYGDGAEGFIVVPLRSRLVVISQRDYG